MKLTQGEFAKEVRVARNTVTRWEIGLVNIPEPIAKLIRMIAEQWRSDKKGAR